MNEAEIPWGMQLAVLYNKRQPARQVDVVEAAARAVVALLASPQAAPGGTWHDDVTYWRDGRIRKLVRRARGVRWQEVQDLSGVTVEQASPTGWGPAAVRAFVPGPVRPLPASLAKLQVEGTNFPTGEGTDIGSTSHNTDAVVHIEVTPKHEMTSGKLAAQCAHAAQLAWESPQMSTQTRDAWQADDYRVEVTFPSLTQWETTTRPVSVTDAGFTELDGPTETTRAWW